MLTREPAAIDPATSHWRGSAVLAGEADEAELDSLSADFTRLGDFLPTLCWLAHPDGSIFWYNARWHEYCGTQHDDVKDWRWQSVHDPEYLPEVLRRWTSAIEASEPFEMTFPIKGADGMFRPFLTRVVPIRDSGGTVVRWLGTNTEIGAQIRAEQALIASEHKYEVLTDAMPQMVWSTLPDGFHDYYNSQWYSFTGVPRGSTDGEAWNGMFHAEDQEKAWERWRHSLETGEPYEIEYRLRHHSGEYRWVLGRALPVRTKSGAISRWIGTCTDIHAAKLVAEDNELLSRELSHRIKNIFAVISGLVSLTSNRVAEMKPSMTELLGRIGALGRAHDFARPHSPESKPQFNVGTLQGLLDEILRPYSFDGEERIVVQGKDIAIDDRSATPIALAMHELATNAAKYGALSDPAGQLTITIQHSGDELIINWCETGGPEVRGVPERTGFGTELADISLKRQLGGQINRYWLAEGLQVEIRLQASRLCR